MTADQIEMYFYAIMLTECRESRGCSEISARTKNDGFMPVDQKGELFVGLVGSSTKNIR